MTTHTLQALTAALDMTYKTLSGEALATAAPKGDFEGCAPSAHSTQRTPSARKAFLADAVATDRERKGYQ